MNLLHDKLGNEFLRSTGGGGMDSGFGSGMLMFSHLPPVTSFARLSAHSVMHELPSGDLSPHDMILKKERDSPDCSSAGGTLGTLGGLGGPGDYGHAMGIKQEKMSELDYRLPVYPGGLGKSAELLEVTVSNNHNLLGHDLNMGNLPSQLGKEPTGRKGRRSNGDGQGAKPRRRRGEAKQSMVDADGNSLSPGNKPHICEHCAASFRSSYHLRRHVLIHTGERPFRCSQCNMSFIQKYLLQRHEKIHSGEKPFCCDQCNMRFIQKYHMERHKRTHSGEKPYRCETCQQFFSRTDRLLKHKRTCGEAIKKGLDPGMMDMGCEGMAHGSYNGITQGNATGTTGQKRRRSKISGEAAQRKRKKADAGAQRVPHIQGAVAGGYSIHEYSMDNQQVSSSTEPGPSMQQDNHQQQQQQHQGRAPKMAFKKANRKSLEKAAQEQNKALEQNGGMDGLGLMPSNGAKVNNNNNTSNYDDAMQFIKKRRYLNAANNVEPSGNVGEYDVGLSHLSSQQPSVTHGSVSGAMDAGETPLSLDKSGIPDEVLQSLLDHYSHKPDGSHHDVHFDLTELSNAVDTSDICLASGSTGDKTTLMHEYSRFLLQALERTSSHHGFPPGAFGGPLYSDKGVYECGFGPTAAQPKSHFAMLTGSSSPQHFQLEQQTLTPSQELTEQMEKNTAAASYQISPSDLSQKDPGKTSSVYPQQELTPLDSKPPYHMEHFAQAFGSQGRSLPYDSELRPPSDFSGFSSLLSDEPVSTGSKTTTSQSYR